MAYKCLSAAASVFKVCQGEGCGVWCLQTHTWSLQADVFLPQEKSKSDLSGAWTQKKDSFHSLVSVGCYFRSCAILEIEVLSIWVGLKSSDATIQAEEHILTHKSRVRLHPSPPEYGPGKSDWPVSKGKTCFGKDNNKHKQTPPISKVYSKWLIFLLLFQVICSLTVS